MKESINLRFVNRLIICLGYNIIRRSLQCGEGITMKIFKSIISLLMVLSLIACGKETTTTTTNENLEKQARAFLEVSEKLEKYADGVAEILQNTALEGLKPLGEWFTYRIIFDQSTIVNVYVVNKFDEKGSFQGSDRQISIPLDPQKNKTLATNLDIEYLVELINIFSSSTITVKDIDEFLKSSEGKRDAEIMRGSVRISKTNISNDKSNLVVMEQEHPIEIDIENSVIKIVEISKGIKMEEAQFGYRRGYLSLNHTRFSGFYLLFSSGLENGSSDIREIRFSLCWAEDYSKKYNGDYLAYLDYELLVRITDIISSAGITYAMIQDFLTDKTGKYDEDIAGLDYLLLSREYSQNNEDSKWKMACAVQTTAEDTVNTEFWITGIAK